jgi:transposase
MDEREQQRKVRHRLAVLRHAEEVSGNVSMTCRYYGISRPMFYEWLHRYEELGELGLRDGSCRPLVSPRATKTEIVGKIIYLRQHYHFGPEKISMYLKRYHDIEVSKSGVWRILKRLDLNRLPSSQRYKRHDKRWKRYEKPLPATASRSTSSSSNPSAAVARSTTSSPPSTTAPGSGSCGSTPATPRRRPSSSSTTGAGQMGHFGITPSPSW